VQDINTKFICRETDFDIFTTVFGTVSFNTTNQGAGNFVIVQGSNGNVINATPTAYSPTVTATRVPTPPCDEGYLIAWVVDSSDRPIKFDGLIGDAIIRGDDGAPSAYNATPIQAAAGIPPLTNNLPTVIATAPGALVFNGAVYQAVPSSIAGSLRFEQPAAAAPPSTEVRTDLTLLTLDVLSNAPNYPTYVELDFFNANEYLISQFHEFICWDQVRLTDIDPFLTVEGMQTRKGLVVSSQAVKTQFAGIADTPGPVTLLGLVTTDLVSTPAAGPASSSAYTYKLFNFSVPQPTAFVFKPFGTSIQPQ